MGVITTCDEHVDKVRDNLKESVNLLFEITVNNPWGWEDYNSDFQNSLEEALSKLLEVKKLL